MPPVSTTNVIPMPSVSTTDSVRRMFCQLAQCRKIGSVSDR